MAYASLELKDPYSPFNTTYGDFYFSRHGPLEESVHVFLSGNRILQRWLKRKHFTIGEIGFGSGLNFLNTLRLWSQTDQAPDHLHYLAWELNPMDPEMMEVILRSFPDLHNWFLELKPQLPPPLPGIYSISMAKGAVTLILIYGDVRHTLPQTNANVDAWYLDGFSPRVNPECWEVNVLCEIARRTREGGTIATYSAASQVRKNLEVAGFSVERCKGFGGKREMLVGRLDKKGGSILNPWGSPPPQNLNREAIILGAGLAGASLAYALNKRNWEVRIYDRHSIPAAEGSGNRGGILYPYLSLNHEAQSQYFWAGYQFTRHLFQEFLRQKIPIAGEEVGILLLEQKSHDRSRWQQYCERYELPHQWLHPVDVDQASRLAKFPLTRGGLFLPSGTWISPTDFCQALMRGSGIRFSGDTPIANISWKNHLWNLHDDSGKIIDQAPWLFLANAMALKNLLPGRSWDLMPVKGQVTYWQREPNSVSPQTILCGGSYLIPHSDDRWEMGATFEHVFEDLSVSLEGHQKNWDPLRKMMLEGPDTLPNTQVTGRSSIRACSKNRWPMLGPLDDEPGLFISCAHGSKGLLSAPLGGECLARFIHDEPIPLSIPMMKALAAPLKSI